MLQLVIILGSDPLDGRLVFQPLCNHRPFV